MAHKGTTRAFGGCTAWALLVAVGLAVVGPIGGAAAQGARGLESSGSGPEAGLSCIQICDRRVRTIRQTCPTAAGGVLDCRERASTYGARCYAHCNTPCPSGTRRSGTDCAKVEERQRRQSAPVQPAPSAVRPQPHANRPAPPRAQPAPGQPVPGACQLLGTC